MKQDVFMQMGFIWYFQLFALEVNWTFLKAYICTSMYYTFLIFKYYLLNHPMNLEPVALERL